MSQNDFTIANQGFPAFRADLNSALQALASNSSGTTEPSTTFANMWWYDSTNNIMYIRNENNDAWIKFAELDQTNDKFVLSGTLQLDDGTVSAPALTFNSDTNMGIYRGGTDILKFVTAGTDAVTIDASQNVGIGTSSPDADLTISSGGGEMIHLISSHSNKAHIEAEAGNGSMWRLGTVDSNPDVRLEAMDATGEIKFLTGGSNERMRIDSNGNLLVGQTATSGVNARGGLMVEPEKDDGAARITFDRVATSASSIAILFRDGGLSKGSISYTDTSTTYSTSSDYRLKENVTADWDATTRLKQLNPVRFNFIADADTTVDGFLAHEVQDVVPEAITGTHNEVEVWQDGEELPDGVSVGDNKLDEDGNTIPVYQGIDQSKLVPLLVKTIQELEARIVALETV